MKIWFTSDHGSPRNQKQLASWQRKHIMQTIDSMSADDGTFFNPNGD